MQGRMDVAGPEVVFDILFGSDEFMRRYHKKVNSDPHAEATSWSKSQEREVKYVATTEVPKMMQKLIGESFPVTELQRFQKNGDCYTITCVPRMESPSADQFVTEAETILAPDASGGCAITSNVTLEYCGAWFKGPVESFMETRARAGFDKWLELAKLFCQEKLAITSAPQDIDVNSERFFDAEESISSPIDGTVPVVPGNVTPIEGTMSVVPESFTPINRIISRFKAAFSASTDSDSQVLDSSFMRTASHEAHDLEQLATKMLKVEDDLVCARQAWERKQRALKEHVDLLNTKLSKIEGDLASVKLAWERQQGVVSRRRQATLVGASFAAGFAAGLTVGYWYVRTKRQT